MQVMASEIDPCPCESMNLQAMTGTCQATPVMPTVLLPTPPMMPLTWVP